MAGQSQRRMVWGAILGCFAVFAAIQAVPGRGRINPPVEPSESLQANLAVPPAVAATLRRSCMNCHSNETRWPWYSAIAPVSWLMASDVAKARKSMNLSRWSTQNGSRPEIAIATLSAACAGMQSGRMPKWDYLLMHPEARVSKLEADQFCAWSALEVRHLIKKKRRVIRAVSE